jgi:hypothetical protein
VDFFANLVLFKIAGNDDGQEPSSVDSFFSGKNVGLLMF